MEPINVEKLTPEALAALIKFGKAASRYYNPKHRKKEFVTVANEKVMRERVIPQSVEMDYAEAKQALLQSQDVELRGILDQLDVAKLLDSLEGQSPEAHT